MVLQWLRRQTLQPSGWAVGGGDTGFDHQAQPSLFTVTLNADQPVRDVLLPKGTLILSTNIVPRFEKAVAGAATVQIDDITAATVLLAATAAKDYLRTPVATPVPLAADTRVRFTASGLLDGEGAVVGVEMIIPRIRA